MKYQPFITDELNRYKYIPCLNLNLAERLIPIMTESKELTVGRRSLITDLLLDSSVHLLRYIVSRSDYCDICCLQFLI